ncbi:hypothetical protein [Hymenobacter canadensis]|uniref:STAS/SEC14 domain-containing protein n=1 Tax=Hymenobacter canadensis TaxID=2999067 RepID=A0ABY7LXF7_9BACT|nr:hypothetical protein [Hymenobacter canadensis]WBA44107.1 hypothetical protein O3303_19655 [Hymenobacter canadensis]
MIVLPEFPVIKVQYAPEVTLLRAGWQAGQPLTRFPEALHLLMQFSCKHTVRNWLIDMQGLPQIGPQELDWILQHWFPAMGGTPVEDLLLVLPSDLHNELVALTPLHDSNIAPSFAIHYFSDCQGALHYLIEQQQIVDRLCEEWDQASGSGC